MKKCMILLAGYPATGKSYLCNLILSKFPQFQSVNFDELKEKKWDEFGFCNLKEKQLLETLAWQEYYTMLENLMEKGEMIISDYPFSEKQKGNLSGLSKKYDYQVITIRMLGNIEKLYERSLKRDLDSKRHLGHLVSSYQKGDVLDDRRTADQLVTYGIFQDRCLNKGYDVFELGKLIKVDATDYSKIDYAKIINTITKYVLET